ncbi:unnamed protein product [Trichobilharzia regenti]|nr:unnamed protein product [Trichobilharzia regenti]
MLPCDYCNACFHLECLNPPLSHFPPRSDRWMCPNHTEHTTERYLARSISLTERMKLWTKLYKNIDGNTSSNSNNNNNKSMEPDEITQILEHIPPYELTTAISSLLDTVLYDGKDKRQISDNRRIWRLNRRLAAKRRNNRGFNRHMRIVVSYPKPVSFFV